jgi:superfamily II DNA/RNA helicase
VNRIGRTGRACASGIAITIVDATYVHRWKMINKALDLPFDDPQETYSSSEHFLHDQGIAPGTTGRIVPEGTVEKKPRPERSGGGGGQRGRGAQARSGGTSDGEKSGDRPAKRRNRSRRRTRGGRPAASNEG